MILLVKTFTVLSFFFKDVVIIFITKYLIEFYNFNTTINIPISYFLV